MFWYDFAHGPLTHRIFWLIVWFLSHYMNWAVFVFQVMVIVFKLLGKLDWPWWAVLLPIEALGVLFVVAGACVLCIDPGGNDEG